MSHLFNPPPSLVLPYALMDLDDTLFQTLRKIEAWQLSKDNLSIATVNKAGEPLSFFTAKQAQFFQWLSHTTELIPVTARDRQEIGRVKLAFHSWQVLTHGAVILQPDGQPLVAWQQRMTAQLQPLQAVLQPLKAYLVGLERQYDCTVTIHDDRFDGQNLMVYMAIKHRQKNSDILKTVADRVQANFPNFADYFYTHRNANNLAILPHAVHKQQAVAFLQQQYFDSQRACFGFGDSLADLPFLQLLDWYGTPRQGQLHEAITAGCV